MAGQPVGAARPPAGVGRSLTRPQTRRLRASHSTRGPAGEPPAGPHWARQVLLTRALTIGGGTTDIQLNIIGERILGLPRDPEPPSGDTK